MAGYKNRNPITNKFIRHWVYKLWLLGND